MNEGWFIGLLPPVQESEDSAVQAMIKETLVLTTKDYRLWNWELIGAAIKVGHIVM